MHPQSKYNIPISFTTNFNTYLLKWCKNLNEVRHSNKTFIPAIQSCTVYTNYRARLPRGSCSVNSITGVPPEQALDLSGLRSVAEVSHAVEQRKKESFEGVSKRAPVKTMEQVRFKGAAEQCRAVLFPLGNCWEYPLSFNRLFATSWSDRGIQIEAVCQ